MSVAVETVVMAELMVVAVSLLELSVLVVEVLLIQGR